MKVLIAICALLAADDAAVWQDAETQLEWTARDNRSGLSWRQALEYCRDLRLGDHADWRLPSIEELQAIYQPRGQAAFHVRGPLQISGWEWSATAGQQKGESWAFDFGDGGRASVAHGDSGLNRALCVRGGMDKR